MAYTQSLCSECDEFVAKELETALGVVEQLCVRCEWQRTVGRPMRTRTLSADEQVWLVKANVAAIKSAEELTAHARRMGEIG